MKTKKQIIKDIESRIKQLKEAPNDINFSKETLIATFEIMLRDYTSN